MYRLVALDLDGTLLNKEKQVSVANIAALTRLHDLGVGLALCTGRAAPSAQRIQQLVNLPLDTICYNGAVVLADQSKIPILQLVIHQEITAKMLEFVEMQGLCMNLYIGQEMYLVHCRNDKHREFARKYESLTGIRYTKLLNRAEGIDDNARSHKLLIFTEQVEQTYQMVLQVCGEKAHVVKEKFFVEVLGINAHKGRGLEELCAFYGIQLSEGIGNCNGEC
jgi:HAD superfamily hydrolase (TIGR01484 family)